jgi:hypothetical protein
VASRGPQQHEQVRVLEEDRREVATATCFYSMWTEEGSGEPRWRGFLASIDPPGNVFTGRYHLEFPSGVVGTVRVEEVRTEPREQAIFTGESHPPAPHPDEPPTRSQ